MSLLEIQLVGIWLKRSFTKGGHSEQILHTKIAFICNGESKKLNGCGFKQKWAWIQIFHARFARILNQPQ